MSEHREPGFRTNERIRVHGIQSILEFAGIVRRARSELIRRSINLHHDLVDLSLYSRRKKNLAHAGGLGGRQIAGEIPKVGNRDVRLSDYVVQCG